MSIPEGYFDIVQTVRRQIKQAGIDLADEDLYDAILAHESRVYGRDDQINTNNAVARLQRRTDTIHTALVAPWVGGENAPTFTDSARTTLMPISSDLRAGEWHFASPVTRVYITGRWVDIYAAALDALDLVLDQKIELVTTSGDLGSMNWSDIQGNIRRLQERLAGKVSILPGSSKG